MLPKTILEPSQMHYEQGSMVTPDDEFQWTFSRRHINICNNNFGKSPSSSAPFSFYNLEICFLLLLLPLSSAAVGKAVLSSSPTPFSSVTTTSVFSSGTLSSLVSSSFTFWR